MTIPSEVYRNQYSGNDSTTVFAYAFRITNSNQLKVIITDSDGVETVGVLGTDYTVSGVGDTKGGNVTYPVSGDPLATGSTLTVKRNPDFTQDTDLLNRGNYSAQAIEDALDYLMMTVHKVQEQIDRGLLLAETSAFSDLIVPDPSADKILGWNVGATALENKVVGDASTVTFPSMTGNAGKYLKVNVGETALTYATLSGNDLETAFDAAQTITIADTENLTLAIANNDVTNNPNTMSITNASEGNGLLIDQNGNGVALNIDSEATTANVISVPIDTLTTGHGFHMHNADALTTGNMIRLTSNSASTSSRSLLLISNTNSASVGATLVDLDQDADAPVINIASDVLTDATIQVASNSLTTGKIMQLFSSSTSTGTRTLVDINNLSALSTGTTALKVTNASTGPLMTLTSSATTGTPTTLTTGALTSGSAFTVNAGAVLTTGTVADFYSGSGDVTPRSLVQSRQTNNAAVGTACYLAHTDGGGAHIRMTGDPANTTNPSDGDFWYDGTNLKFYDGSATKTITWS